VRAAIRAWLISAVARIFQPGCQADYVLVLEGRQGIKKSTALRVLASDAWFSDSLPNDVGHKDSKAHLLGKWIIELPEFAQFKRSEIETVKAFITRRHEQFRPSYGRHEVTFERQCVFAGSTNEAEYLVDQTGNRRFWPIACGELDLPALVRDRDQLWAEAVHAYRSSEAWYLPAHIEALASTETQKRVTCDPWMGMVAQILDDLMPYVRDIAPGEVLAKMDIAKEQRNSRAAARVGAILRDLGWRRGNRHSTRGQLFERPDA
jgi:predicted P-loop ATPase